ncbi:MAG: hypothetical protein IH591_04505 [Bacteroidales bacterium]|nr:hypothetical protein [Bacteroidales bacterium]
MKSGGTVFSYKGLEVSVTSEADDDVISLLSSTVVGSEGGMQYTMRNIGQRILAYGDNIRLVSLRRNYTLAGVIGTCYRECRLGGIIDRCTYLRFLSFRQTWQTEKVFTKRERHSDKNSETDSFKRQTLNIFSKPHLLGFPGVAENDRHVLYAYVESRNERSKNIIQQAGYEYIRSFLTVAFSRFSPLVSDKVSPAVEDEYPEIRKLMKEFYNDYSFYFDDIAFHGNNYYVLREEGRIIAGVSAIPTEYIIKNVPGVWGWIMMKILPFAPYFRRLFHPGLFRFAALGSIFHAPGRADALNTLFESVCAATGCHTALTWADDRGPLFETLRNSVDMGTLNRMLNAKPGLVYARFIGFTEEEKELYYDAPAFIAGFDFT